MHLRLTSDDHTKSSHSRDVTEDEGRVSGDTEHPTPAWALFPPAEIVATVGLAPVPQIPFASLRGSLVASYDADGVLVDWSVAASALDDPELVAEYWRWRRRWQSSWSVGPISNLAALLRTVDEIEHDLGPQLAQLLRQLIAAQGEVVDWPVDDAPGLLHQIDALRDALRDTIEAGPGAGIVDDTPGPGRSVGLSRTWAPDDIELVLSATSTTAVIVRPGDGLVVLYDGPQFRSLTWVVEVDLLGDQVVVTNDEGDRLELTPELARPLAWLVPRSLRWHVQTVPLVAVWTPLLTGLPDAIRAAELVHADIRFSAQLAVH